MRFAVGSMIGFNRSVLAALAVAACAMLAAGAAAAPYTVLLEYQTISGIGTASGSVTFDDSLLTTPGTKGTHCDPSLISSFTLTVSGLPPTPTSTTFGLGDLVGWLLTVDPNGRVTDINFFMQAQTSPTCTGKSNSDGFQIEGVDPFSLDLIAPTGGTVGEYRARPLQIPAASHWGLAALAALLAAAGAVALRRMA